MAIWLFRNKPVGFATIIVISTIIAAIFAYLLATDKSSNANNMILELSAKPPGYKTKLLKIPNHQNNETSFFHFLINGKNTQYNFVPIVDFSIDNDNITAIHFLDEGITDTLNFPLSTFTQNTNYNSKADFEKEFIVTQKYILGTDRYGRDIYSRLLLGARVSLAVGIISVIISIGIGIILGAIAGWYGGITDKIVMWLINVLWAIPTLLLVFAVAFALGKGFWIIFVTIGLTSWVSTARLIRGQVMQTKELDYITAAKTLGYNDFRIITKHILPNIAGPILVIAATNFASAILIEAGLSFLGFGVQPPTPSWGLMIKEHYGFLVAGNPIPAIIPGLAIMLLVLAFHLLGNALRDKLDVQM